MAASLLPTEGGNPIPLDKPIVLIGRHQECDVSLLSSSKVSRRHCCIVQVGDRFVLRDLGSMNGIRVNGHRVIETELCAGDEVSVADVAFQFQRDDAPRAGSARSAPSIRPRVVSHDVSSQFPVALPDEKDGEEPQNGGDDFRDPALGADSRNIRLKDDSHSESGFVRV